jgi:hypothetical protein
MHPYITGESNRTVGTTKLMVRKLASRNSRASFPSSSTNVKLTSIVGTTAAATGDRIKNKRFRTETHPDASTFPFHQNVIGGCCKTWILSMPVLLSAMRITIQVSKELWDATFALDMFTRKSSRSTRLHAHNLEIIGALFMELKMLLSG